MADVPTHRCVARSYCRGVVGEGRSTRGGFRVSNCLVVTSLARSAVRRALVMSHGPVRPDGGAQTNTTAVLQSIDVTEAYRALFRETYKGDQAIIVFHLIGTHKELYGL